MESIIKTYLKLKSDYEELINDSELFYSKEKQRKLNGIYLLLKQLKPIVSGVVADE